MQAIDNVGQLDWKGWLRGLVGAFISAGAGSIGTFAGVETVLDIEITKTLQIAGIAALVSAVVSLAKFLQTTPLPTYIQAIEQAKAASFAEGAKAVADASWDAAMETKKEGSTK